MWLALFVVLAAATLTIWMDDPRVGKATQAAVLVLGLAATLNRIRNRSEKSIPLRVQVAAALLLAGPVWGGLQLLLGTSSAPGETLSALLEWFSRSVLFLLAGWIFVEEGPKWRFLRLSTAFAAFLCCLGVLQFFTSSGRFFWIWPGSEPVAIGPFQSRNNYASFALLFLPLLLWRAITHAKAHPGWLVCAGLLGASVVVSGSRAGTALLIAELVFFFVLICRAKLWPRAGVWAQVLLLVTTLLGLVALMGADTLLAKLKSDDWLRYRRQMISSAVRMSLERPLTGFGLGTFPHAYPAYAAFDSGHFVNHAHNDWAEWAAEGGFPFLAMLGSWAVVVACASLGTPWGVGIPAVFLHALVDYPFQRFGLAAWVYVLAAALLTQAHASERQHGQTPRTNA